MISPHIEIPMDEIEALCQKYPVRKLSLFGSVLRDDFRPDSDVDVLVEFQPTARVTLFEMAELQIDLRGRGIDLKTPGFLSDRFRDEIV